MAAADFPRAHLALKAYYQAQLSTMDPDYYLFSFTDTELLEIVTHPDEWGHLDYALAKKLLADRGKPLSPAACSGFLSVTHWPTSKRPCPMVSGSMSISQVNVNMAGLSCLFRLSAFPFGSGVFLPTGYSSLPIASSADPKLSADFTPTRRSDSGACPISR